MAITRIQEAYYDSESGVALVKQPDGTFYPFIAQKNVDDAFKVIGLFDVTSKAVQKALNRLLVHLNKF
jgi:hypothetical protein